MNNFILILLINLFSLSLMASETPKESEKKEEAEPASTDFAKQEAALTGLKGKLTAEEKEIRELLELKNQTTDPKKVHEMAAEIKLILKERLETIKKYNKELHFIQYELPGKGEALTKKYKRIDEKTIKDFEDEVNKLLSDAYNNVKKKYD